MTPEQQAAMAKRSWQAEKAAEAKVKAAEAAALKEKLEHAQNWFEIMPGVEGPQVKIKRAA